MVSLIQEQFFRVEHLSHLDLNEPRLDQKHEKQCLYSVEYDPKITIHFIRLISFQMRHNIAKNINLPLHRKQIECPICV